jgi:hypothetical protein
MTLTCKLGSFIFPKGVSLLDAKAIRDTIMGEYFSGSKKLRSVEDCKKVLNGWEHRAKSIQFGLVLNPR